MKSKKILKKNLNKKMHNRKGFTLVELIGVLIILVVIMIIGIPAITSLVKSSENDISVASKALLTDAAKDYLSEKDEIYTKYSGNVYCISFEQLVNNGNLTDTQLNNVGDEYSTIKVTYNGNKEASYELASDDCMEHYNNARLELKGSKTVSLKLKSDINTKDFDNLDLIFTYYENDVEKSVVVPANVYSDRTSNLVITSASLKTGEVKECSSSSNCIPQINVGSYTIKYEYNAEDGKTYYAERTIKILDEEAPVIKLDKDEEIISSSSKSFDLKAGISVTDNSGEVPTLSVSSNLSLGKVGTYTVTYTVTDSSGNSSKATKKIIIENKENNVVIDVGMIDDEIEINSRTYTEEDIMSGVLSYDQFGRSYESKMTYSIRKNLKEVNKVDISSLGEYIITYKVESEGVSATRTILVKDSIIPVITLTPTAVGVMPDESLYPNVLDGVTVTDNSKETINAKASVSKLTFPSGSKQTVTYTATDSSGNTATATREYTRYGKPTTPVLTGGSSEWKNTDVTVSISNVSTVTEGIAYYEYCISSSTSSSSCSWSKMSDNKVTLTTTQHSYVFVRAVSTKNVKGEISAYAEVKIDKDTLGAPTITGGSTSWTSSSRTISVSKAPSSSSGIKKYQYYISTSSSSQTGGTWNDMSGTSIKVSTNGTRYVFVKAINNAGTTGSISSYQVTKVDGGIPTAPTLTANTTSWSQTNVTVSVSSSATAVSGISKYQYYISSSASSLTGGTWTDMSGKSVIISTEGVRFIYVRGVSGAGTAGTSSSYRSTFIDFTNPKVSATVSGKVVTITFSDNIGVAYWGVNQSSTTPSSLTSIASVTSGTKTWDSATEAGTYYVWVKDVAGRTSSYPVNISSNAFSYPSTASTSTYSSKQTSYTGSYGTTGRNETEGTNPCCGSSREEGDPSGPSSQYYGYIMCNGSIACTYYNGGTYNNSCSACSCSCTTTSYSCPSGYTMSGSTCYRYTCNSGDTGGGSSSTCYTYTCNSGDTLSSDKKTCTTLTYTCPNGGTLSSDKKTCIK